MALEKISISGISDVYAVSAIKKEFKKAVNQPWKNSDPYRIHRPNSRKNVRIIYTIIDRKIIILLTVFLEKNKSDYQNAISVAKNRLKQLQE